MSSCFCIAEHADREKALCTEQDLALSVVDVLMVRKQCVNSADW
jgi:hypothetical protein